MIYKIGTFVDSGGDHLYLLENGRCLYDLSRIIPLDDDGWDLFYSDGELDLTKSEISKLVLFDEPESVDMEGLS